MLFILVLATFSKYADVRAKFVQRMDSKEQRKGSSLPEDYAEALRQEGFSSASQQEEESSDKNDGVENQSLITNPIAEDEEEKDETLRGRFYRFFQVCYVGIKWTLQKGLNFATIHSTKVAMIVLFLVTAVQPNIFNGFLFVLFLSISMGNNSQMQLLWRFTLVAISVLLFA